MMGILKDMIANDDFESKRWELVPSYLNFIHFCNDHDEHTNLPDIWRTNAEINLEWLKKRKEIKSVREMPNYSNKAMKNPDKILAAILLMELSSC